MSFTIKIWVERELEIECDYEEDGDKVTIVNVGQLITAPLSPPEVMDAIRSAHQEVYRRWKENKK